MGLEIMGLDILGLIPLSGTDIVGWIATTNFKFPTATELILHAEVKFSKGLAVFWYCTYTKLSTYKNKFCCSGKLKTSCCYSTQPLSINVSHQLVGKAEKKIATCMIPLTQSAPYLSVYLHLLDLLVVKDVSSPCCGVVLFLSCVSQLKKLSSVSGY